MADFCLKNQHIISLDQPRFRQSVLALIHAASFISMCDAPPAWQKEELSVFQVPTSLHAEND